MTQAHPRQNQIRERERERERKPMRRQEGRIEELHHKEKRETEQVIGS
jgi:hypothetical protein